MSTPIVAIGARTPLGYEAGPSAAAVRAGLSQFRDHPFLVDGSGNGIRSALDDGLDAERFGGVRLLVLARSALQEALTSLPKSSEGAPRLDILLSLPETRPGFTEANALWIGHELVAGIADVPAHLVERGHAGALDALGEANRRIEAGSADLCAIVGVDSYFSPATIEWLRATRRLAEAGVRDGFIPGEAAGCIILASPYAMGALRLQTLANVRAVHSTRESVLVSGDEEVLGHGLAAAIRGAASHLSYPLEAVDDIYCDINGERYRTDEWGFAVLRLENIFRNMRYQMPASCWGDVGAASGALSCVLAVRAWSRGYASGPLALAWGSSDGGLRSGAILEQSCI